MSRVRWVGKNIRIGGKKVGRISATAYRREGVLSGDDERLPGQPKGLDRVSIGNENQQGEEWGV